MKLRSYGKPSSECPPWRVLLAEIDPTTFLDSTHHSSHFVCVYISVSVQVQVQARRRAQRAQDRIALESLGAFVPEQRALISLLRSLATSLRTSTSYFFKRKGVGTSKKNSAAPTNQNTRDALATGALRVAASEGELQNRTATTGSSFLPLHLFD